MDQVKWKYRLYLTRLCDAHVGFASLPACHGSAVCMAMWSGTSCARDETLATWKGGDCRAIDRVAKVLWKKVISHYAVHMVGIVQKG